MHSAAVLRSLLACHVLLGFDGCRAVTLDSSFHELHVNLGTGSHMVSPDLRLLRVWLLLNLDLGGDLSRGRIELVIHDLVVVDQSGSVRTTNALRVGVYGAVNAGVRYTTGRVEKRSTELLARCLTFIIRAIFHAL